MIPEQDFESNKHTVKHFSSSLMQGRPEQRCTLACVTHPHVRLSKLGHCGGGAGAWEWEWRQDPALVAQSALHGTLGDAPAISLMQL